MPAVAGYSGIPLTKKLGIREGSRLALLAAPEGFGATLGKMAVKIRVVNPDGTPITWGKAIARYFAEIVSGLTLGIGYIMAGFDPERRALHDRIASTRVVRV